MKISSDLRLETKGHNYGDAQERQWYAIYTKPRHEKVVKRILDEKSIESFLPLQRVHSRWVDRKVELLLPIFPGYLFAKYSVIDDSYKILSVLGIVKVVAGSEGPLPIPDDQISSLVLLVKHNLRFEEHEYLRIGQRVRVINGPLAGISGILLRNKSRNRVVLSIELIQRSLAVEVDQSELEPVKCQKALVH